MDISSFYTSVPKIMIIGYTVPETWHVTDVIVIFHFGLFFALSPRNSPKNDTFKKMKRKREDMILYNCTKNHDHMLYCSWDMVHDGCNCYFSFQAIFCLFTQVYQKSWSYAMLFLRHGVWQILFFILGYFLPFYHHFSQKKMKKNARRYHHFTQLYQKPWSYAI